MCVLIPNALCEIAKVIHMGTSSVIFSQYLSAILHVNTSPSKFDRRGKGVHNISTECYRNGITWARKVMEKYIGSVVTYSSGLLEWFTSVYLGVCIEIDTFWVIFKLLDNHVILPWKVSANKIPGSHFQRSPGKHLQVRYWSSAHNFGIPKREITSAIAMVARVSVDALNIDRPFVIPEYPDFVRLSGPINVSVLCSGFIRETLSCYVS